VSLAIQIIKKLTGTKSFFLIGQHKIPVPFMIKLHFYLQAAGQKNHLVWPGVNNNACTEVAASYWRSSRDGDTQTPVRIWHIIGSYKTV